MSYLQHLTMAGALIAIIGFALAMRRSNTHNEALISDLLLAMAYILAVNSHQLVDMPDAVRSIWQIFDMLVIINLLVNLRHELQANKVPKK